MVKVVLLVAVCLVVGIKAQGYMTDALRSAYVDSHNAYRSKVALGNAVNKNGTNLPKATNMYELVVNSSLEALAQSWADTCTWGYNKPAGVGQNIWATASTGGYRSVAVALNTSVNSWYAELASSGVDTLTMTGMKGNQFTQLAWAQSLTVGCAVKNCTSMVNWNAGPNMLYTFVVCDYTPAGNKINENIYEAGSVSASACPAGTANSVTGLCQVNGVAASTTVKPTTTNSGTVTPATTKAPVPSNQSYPITDAQRMFSVNSHNILRSEVALGNAVNKNGTKLPKATNMYEITWNKTLEGIAQSWADRCIWAHNTSDGQGSNLGQNNWMQISGSAFAGTAFALNASTYSWYAELKNDGQDSLTMSGSNYNHFTQVAWAKSFQIGCGVRNCTSMGNYNNGATGYYTFVVCDYSPPGNYRGQPIYAAGSTSASACPAGSTANAATGLCTVNGLAAIH